MRISNAADRFTNGAFGLPKMINQYCKKLNMICLNSHEHILDYISSIKDLQTSILDTRRAQSSLTSKIAEIDALFARSFCDGLLLNY